MKFGQNHEEKEELMCLRGQDELEEDLRWD